MKTKIYNLFAIAIMFILLISSCLTTPPKTSIPISPTSTALSFSEPTNTLTSIPVVSTPTLVPEEAFIKGITLNYSGNGPKLGTLGAQEVIQKYIIPSGANYVILVPSCWSINMNDTNIVCPIERIEGGVPPISDEELINAVNYLHSVGQRVVLKPQALIETVHISNQEPKVRRWSEDQWKAWFDNYILFITHYAQIAEAYDVGLFVVGNEQEDNTMREADWRRVIEAVREVYHGKITYAANAFQFEASRIKFWDALDYIGTNGYAFGKVSKNNPSINDMIQAWQPYIQRLEEMSNQYERQVLITEIGALPVQGWNIGGVHEGTARAYAGQEQADFYTAFFEALHDKPWLKGILLWDVDTDPLQGGSYDIGYTFIGKPAEQVVRHYFEGSTTIEIVQSDFVEDPGLSITVYDEGLSGNWHTWIDSSASEAPDMLYPVGHESSYSIRLPLSRYQGIAIDSNLPFVNMSGFKWIGFHIMTGEHPPKNLLVQFEYWTPDEVSHSRRVLVNDPDYIEGGQYQPGKWQWVRIPLIDLEITDQTFTGFSIYNCAFPCELDRTVDDVYIDNIQLIGGVEPGSVLSPTKTPEPIEDTENSMLVYSETLSAGWRLWD